MNTLLKARVEKYNRAQIPEFQKRIAARRFLRPVALTLSSPVPCNYDQPSRPFRKKEEGEHFEALHFLKYRLHNELRLTIREQLLSLILALRNRIVSANIGLIYRCIQITTIRADFDVLISAGNIALVMSADTFDPWRGYRFSTYACRTILRGFIKEIVPQRHNLPMEPSVDPQDLLIQGEDSNEDLYLERIRVAIEETPMKDVEWVVMTSYFGVNGQQLSGPLNLDQVGNLPQIKELLGHAISKERVRQIKRSALRKMKESLDIDPALW